MDTTELNNFVNVSFQANVISTEKLGNGISGNVFKIIIDKPPYTFAVKISKEKILLKNECDTIGFIRSLVDIKLPEIYDLHYGKTENYMFMQFFDGIACSSDYVLDADVSNRLKLAGDIADNIAKLQKIHNKNYGNIFSPEYDTWTDFYINFVNKVMSGIPELIENKILDKAIFDTLKLAYENFDRIFDDPITEATLIHGDYWASNIIVDRKMNLIGVVDPFNSLWADGEYELFALNAVYGDKLPVLEAFLNKYPVSRKFELKNAFYILFSESYWVIVMRHDNNDYLRFLSENFNKQMKRFGLN